ncbi:LuxR C-terminal-related transcriptional regulator [Chryseobacterium sp. R2A-55]|uniref:LuxR C-terminal-related transcriptional regulator n=1 Tax=Chryseobacterium sp. R2A-55 TaxID=2744445 RepID=UPI001F3FCE31|nr:LuxR C-terminal-related transcriptional regulator [Chryseobacterium sp. R2A-55]
MEFLPYYHQALEIWKNVSRGAAHPESISVGDISRKLNAVFHVGPYYYYIFDLGKGSFDYVDDSIKDILGIEPNAFTVPAFFEALHPEDLPYFVGFEKKVSEFFGSLPVEKLNKYKASQDFRIKNANGNYIRILHQVVPFNFSERGEVSKSFGIHTEISHLKDSGEPRLSFIGLEGEPSFINIRIDESAARKTLELFSNREREIVKKLCEGFSTDEIAESCFISIHTVRSHRKSILKKAGVNSTNELIIKVIKEGLV